MLAAVGLGATKLLTCSRVACSFCPAPMAAPAFVRYNRDGKIVDIDEFQVAIAILAGDTQALSREAQSRHLFELCMAFGRQSTAAALLTHGVPGCRLEVWHLGPYAGKADSQAIDVSCMCGSSWRTCYFCCWGWAEYSGEYMVDWGAELADAIACAHEAVEQPVAHAVLPALRSGEPLDNLVVSAEAMARLLDMAILTGDVDLAQKCAQSCALRPLRRWRSQDLFPVDQSRPMIALEPAVMTAAILSGMRLQRLNIGMLDWWGELDECIVPLREATALCGDMHLWQSLARKLPAARKPWIPRLLDSGLLLCTPGEPHFWNWELCMNRLKTTALANMALGQFVIDDPYGYFRHRCRACGAEVLSFTPENAHSDRYSLLDIAVSGGQSACAELLASRGAAYALKKWTRQACLPDKRCDRCGEVALAAVANAPLPEPGTWLLRWDWECIKRCSPGAMGRRCRRPWYPSSSHLLRRGLRSLAC